jgi:Protein of unknown function (DUF3017)
MADSGVRRRLSPTPSQTRRVLAEWPILTVMAGVAFGMLLVVQDHVLIGSGFMGLSMLGAAGLRLILPTRTAGTLAIRRRAVDVAVYGALGFLLIVLGVLVQGVFSS